MSPRRAGDTGADGPGPDDLARLRRQMAETTAAGAKAPARRRRTGRATGDGGDDPAAWEPGEVWNTEDAFDACPGADGAGTDGVGGGAGAGATRGAADRRGRFWESDAPGRPIRVEGGLAARTERGRIGGSWWSRRFLAAIEAVMEGGRPGRGRAYARAGQVLAMEVHAGVIEALVQGSRDDPYRIRLSMPVVAPDDWGHIMGDLAARSGYAARMLAGELPHELEGVFEAQGSALFPGPGARLTTECTCPDWANPCKHIAAVCYLVAESFDDDPFSLLAWRGHAREEVLAELRRRRAGAAAPAADAAASAEPGKGTTQRRGAAGAGDPLEPLMDDWWHAGGTLADVRVRPTPVADPAGVLARVAPDVLRVGSREIAELLAPLYPVLSAAALRQALGDG